MTDLVELRKVMKIVQGSVSGPVVFAVGGCVRDALLSRAASDFDLAVIIPTVAGHFKLSSQTDYQVIAQRIDTAMSFAGYELSDDYKSSGSDEQPGRIERCLKYVKVGATPVDILIYNEHLGLYDVLMGYPMALCRAYACHRQSITGNVTLELTAYPDFWEAATTKRCPVAYDVREDYLRKIRGRFPDIDFVVEPVPGKKEIPAPVDPFGDIHFD